MIDMRLRPPLPGWRNSRLFSIEPFNALAHVDFPRSPSADSHDMHDLLAEMDAAGIETGVAMGRQSPGAFGVLPNDELVDLVRTHPGRFVAWAGLDVTQPMDVVLAEVERTAAQGVFKGYSIEPTMFSDFSHASDRKLYPLYERLQQLQLPVNISMSCALQVGSSQPLNKIDPGHLVPATKDFPQLQFHIAHACWPFVREAIAVAISRPNVWLSPDMYLVPQFVGGADYAHAARHFLQRRMLFGTAYPFKPLAATVAGYRSWGFGAALEQAIYRDNPRRLMNLE